MKRLIIVLIGAIVLALTWFSEIALSKIESDEWSHYTHHWETEWSIPKLREWQVSNAMAENRSAVSHTKLLTNKN
jgi:hypothetical protein